MYRSEAFISLSEVLMAWRLAIKLSWVRFALDGERIWACDPRFQLNMKISERTWMGQSINCSGDPGSLFINKLESNTLI